MLLSNQGSTLTSHTCVLVTSTALIDEDHELHIIETK